MLDEAVKSNRKEGVLWAAYGWILEKEGQHEEAIALLGKRSSRPTPPTTSSRPPCRRCRTGRSSSWASCTRSSGSSSTSSHRPRSSPARASGATAARSTAGAEPPADHTPGGGAACRGRPREVRRRPALPCPALRRQLPGPSPLRSLQGKYATPRVSRRGGNGSSRAAERTISQRPPAGVRRSAAGRNGAAASGARVWPGHRGPASPRLTMFWTRNHGRSGAPASRAPPVGRQRPGPVVDAGAGGARLRGGRGATRHAHAGPGRRRGGSRGGPSAPPAAGGGARGRRPLHDAGPPPLAPAGARSLAPPGPAPRRGRRGGRARGAHPGARATSTT